MGSPSDDRPQGVLIAATPDEMLNLQFRLGQVRQEHLMFTAGKVNRHRTR